MALQTLSGGGIYIPAITASDFDASFQALLLNAAGKKVGFVFKVAKTGTITKVGFLTRGVTTSATLRISLQTVDASGNPSGTLYGGSTAGTLASPAAWTFYEVTLGTGANATAGDYVAAVIEFDSTAGNLNIGAIWSLRTSSGNLLAQLPYTDEYATTWTKSGYTPVLSIGYSDGTYANVGTLPLVTIAAISFNSGSTPDERALRFSLPFPARVVGYWMHFDLLGNADIVLYEGTVAKATASLVAANKGTGTRGMFIGYFPTPYVISKDTEYFLSIKPTTTTNVYSSEYTVSAAALWNCIDAGPNFYFASRTDAGAWTVDTLRRIWAGIIIDQLDDGVGGGAGGGMKVHLGMDGGMRG